MEIKLKIPCPVCVEEGITGKDINWRHTSGVCKGNSGSLIVNERAMVSCDDSNCNTSWFISSAKWFCPEHALHQNLKENKESAYSLKLEILRSATFNLKSEESQQFFEKLLRSL